jgi:hypothetical protein
MIFSLHFFQQIPQNMEPRNKTAIPEFLLLELTYYPELQALIFSVFLSMYLVTILGNLLIILAISCQSHLNTPMYFFLFYVSFNDICLSTTTTIPKIQAQDQSITLHRLSHSGLLCHGFCTLWKLSPHSNGLWLLCGHLWTPEVHSYHEPLSLYHAGSTQPVH